MKGRAAVVTVLVILAATLGPGAVLAEEGKPAIPEAPPAAAPAPEAPAPPESSPAAPVPAPALLPGSPTAQEGEPGEGEEPSPGAVATEWTPVAPEGEAGKAPPEGVVHTVKEGDTLWDLSARHLGSPWLWPDLWERNRFITNPHYIYPGIKVVIVDPPARQYAFEGAAPGAPPVAESAEAAPAAPAVAEAPPPPAPAPETPSRRILPLKPAEFVRGGEFLPARPSGIGTLAGGTDGRVMFATGDRLYLKLDKELPGGQLLGVYRLRGPVKGPAGRHAEGYVKYLVGILRVERAVDGLHEATVKTSFEDIILTDLVQEEIPGYRSVYVDPGAEGLESSVITGRTEKKELATGDFLYIDRGAAEGVSPGNVFRLYAVDPGPGYDPYDVGKLPEKPPVEVGKAIVVAVRDDSATVYVLSTSRSFEAGTTARRGIPSR